MESQNQDMMIYQLVDGVGGLKAQNDEIIRRLNQQNGRVDRLEAMQWRIVVYMAAAVGGTQWLVELVFSK